MSDYLDEFAEEKALIKAREKRWRDDRRSVCDQLYKTDAGKWFIFYLLDDLRFFDTVTTDADIVMRNFAVDMLREYFGVLADSKDHRSMVLEAIMSVQRSEGNDNE